MLGTLFSGGVVTPSAQVPLSFRMSVERALHLNAEQGYDALPTWHHLSHHIKRYPHDLRAHVQRILLARNDELSNRLAGSLLDLFLALDDTGHMLKERILNLCAAELDEESEQLLRGLIQDRPAAEQTGTAWRNGSVFATGISSKQHKLLFPQKVESPQNYSSVQAEVQDYLEYGQIDLAQELLETEILAGRSTPELEQELLIVYQHTRNKEGLMAFISALSVEGDELSETWTSALNEAANW